MRSTSTSVLSLVASWAVLVSGQNCPSIHIFGARETTVGPGYGSAGRLVDMIKSAHPGATSEAITYPACGGQASCGGIQYGDSARQGTTAVATAVNNFHTRCPSTQIVLVGYSQGGQIMDNALCGGPDTGAGIGTSAPPISASAINMVKAAIFMGDPRFQTGLAFNVGTCRAGGFSARPAGYVCPNGSKVKSYCDSQDPYCCTGNDANHHQQYVSIYGQQALTFINSQLSGSSPSPDPNPPTNPDPGNPGGQCAALWAQCGGQGFTGPTCCSQGTCKASNQWYSQCTN